MRRYLLDGHGIMSITGRVNDHGGTPMEVIGQMSEIRFSEGTRLSNIILSNPHHQYLEADEPIEFLFLGDRKSSVLLAVRLPDGEIVEMDTTTFETAANALTVRGCMMLFAGLLFAIILIGIPFLLGAFGCFWQASTARMRVRLARRIVDRGGFTDADLDSAYDEPRHSNARSIPQPSAF